MLRMPPYPPVKHGQIVVWGLLAAYPFGGMIWQVLHHLVGLRRLGFDVWYVEDSRIRLRDPTTWWPTEDVARSVAFLDATLRNVGLEHRWVLRVPDAKKPIHGALDADGLERLYRSADAVINLCGSHYVRPDHAGIRKLVMIETDPGHPQVMIAEGREEYIDQYSRHDHHFTYGENIGSACCKLPVTRFQWLPTRPPVSIELWGGVGVPAPGAAFTTVAAWRSEGKDVTWQGERWSWSKHHEFERILGLPSQTPAALEIAIEAATDADLASLRALGWRLQSAMLLADASAYRYYIQASAGELTAAKEQYVKARSGWFSDRSVCYLAAGRPAIVQDTGIRHLYPTGEGLLTFSSAAEAGECIASVLSDYDRHSRAAREIAAEHFRSEKILGSVLGRIGLL